VPGEDGVHGLGTLGDHRLELAPVDLLGYRRAAIGLPGNLTFDLLNGIGEGSADHDQVCEIILAFASITAVI
jgi:hypothetical protein